MRDRNLRVARAFFGLLFNAAAIALAVVLIANSHDLLIPLCGVPYHGS